MSTIGAAWLDGVSSVRHGRRMQLLSRYFSSLLVLIAVVGSPRAAPSDPTAPLQPPLTGPLVVLNPFVAPPNRYGAGHRGVDLGAETGTAVLAGADGVVVYAGQLIDRGVVSIDALAGLRTSYEPVTPAVKAGQRVRAGQLIGLLEPGHPRCAPVTCLHWGARVNGTYVDPMLLLEPLHVRLLPWEG